jgi:Na+/H+ antiporter NhaA
MLSFQFYFVFILLCSVVKNNVHTTAERVLHLLIVSISKQSRELETLKHDLKPAKPHFRP